MESLRNRPRFFVKISSLLRPRFPHNFFHGRKSEISAQSARLKTRVGSYFVSFFLFFQPNTIRSIRTQFEKRKKKVGGETTTKNEKLLSSNSRYTFVAWWVFFNSRHARGRVPSKIAKGGEIFIDVFLQRPPVNRWWSRASQITGGWIINMNNKKTGGGEREREAGLIKSGRHLGDYDWCGCECLCKFSEEPGKISSEYFVIFFNITTDITPVITYSIHSTSWNSSAEFRVHRQWRGQYNQW